MTMEMVNHGAKPKPDFQPVIRSRFHNDFKIECEQGYLSASIDKSGECGRFHIEYIRVYRDHRCGIGRALVAMALEEAMRREATHITAEITSAQSMAIMQSIFGEDAVTVKQFGGYWEVPEEGFNPLLPEARTSAMLDYRLQ